MKAPTLGTLEAILVDAAREELIPRFGNVVRKRKGDRSLVTEADLAVQDRVAKELAGRWPETPLLSEEMSSEEQARIVESGRSFWCLDPLDGTTNFASGIPFYSISLALIDEGRVELGVVHDPWRGECFSAVKGRGAFLNGERQAEVENEVPLHEACAIVDLKRLPEALVKRLIGEAPCASLRSFGSVALEWCWLAIGRGHVYLHGRQHFWDYAAGNFVFEASGGHSARLEAGPVFRLELAPSSAVAAMDESLFCEWTRWLGVEP